MIFLRYFKIQIEQTIKDMGNNKFGIKNKTQEINTSIDKKLKLF